MNHKIIKEIVLDEMKENIKANLQSYEAAQNDFFCNLLDYEITEDEINLEVNNLSKQSEDDLINAISIYEHYRDIPLSLASDEKFWSYLTHTCFWEYMIKRWPIPEDDQKKVNFVKTRYFYGQKNFYRNGISRLWWYAHLTFDDKLEDKYYYTRMLLSDQELAGIMTETLNVSRNKTIIKAVLQSVTKLEQMEKRGQALKKVSKRDFLRGLAKYTNLVGGVTIWDRLSEEEAFNKVWIYVESQISYNEVTA